MIIDLSEKFIMYDERGRNKLAWVEDGILKLKVLAITKQKIEKSSSLSKAGTFFVL